MYIPVQPLKEYLDQNFPVPRKNGMDNEVRSAALGITLMAYRKLIQKKNVRWYTADRYATNLGTHPAMIWRDWYELTDREKISA
jgi:hypothetical protein